MRFQLPNCLSHRSTGGDAVALVDDCDVITGLLVNWVHHVGFLYVGNERCIVSNETFWMMHFGGLWTE